MIAAASSSAGGGAPNGDPVGRVARERADHRLAGAVAEQVARPRRRTSAPAPGPSLARRQHQVGAAADDGERAAAELALGQLGHAGDLVGDGRRVTASSLPWASVRPA